MTGIWADGRRGVSKRRLGRLAEPELARRMGVGVGAGASPVLAASSVTQAEAEAEGNGLRCERAEDRRVSRLQ